MKVPVLFKDANEYHHSIIVCALDVKEVCEHLHAPHEASILVFRDPDREKAVLGSLDDVQNALNMAVLEHYKMKAAAQNPLYITFESAVADEDIFVNVREVDLSKAQEETFQTEDGFLHKEPVDHCKTTLPFYAFANRAPVEVLGSLEEVTKKMNAAYQEPSAAPV